MYNNISEQELINSKKTLDSQIEQLRVQILTDLNKLEVLCKQGLEVQEELNKRENVSKQQSS